MVSSINDLSVGIETAHANDTKHIEPHELLRQLPPSGRDFDVFEHVVVGGGTTRTAAQEFKISQTRVCQVLERVRAWVDEVTPAAADEQVSQKQLQMAEGLAADRLDHLYGQALVGWRSSEGEVERIRISPIGERLTTRTISNGDPRYLAIAARIALLRSKVASLGALEHAMAVAADLEDETIEPQTPAETIDHPDRACSENGEFGVRNGELNAANGGTSRSLPPSSDPLTHEQAAARRAFFGPVQRPGTGDLAAAESVLTTHGTRSHMPQRR